MSTFNERYDEYKKKKGGDSFQSRYLKHKVDKGEIDIDAVGKDLSNRVNTWLDNNQKYFAEANTRFSGDNSSYRSDASDWLNSATSKNNTFKTEADSIKKDLDYYAPLLGQDYVNSVLKALDGNIEAHKSILDAANKDVEYWSQWENEGAWRRDYESNLAQAEQNEKDLAYDLIAGSAKIEQYQKDFANINIGIERTQNTLAQLRVERATLTGRMDAKSKNRMSEIDRQIAACEKAISDAISQQGGIKQAIEDEKKKYSSAERAQKSESYKALTKENDFVLNSQPISKYIGGESFNNFAGMYTDLGYADYEDLLHGYINGEPAARRVVSVNYGPEATLYGYDKSQLLEMTPEEVSIYNYVYNTEGKEAAKNYIDLIMSDLNARKRTKEQEYWAKEADQSPFLMSIFSIATSPLKTVSFVGQTADYIEDGAIDQNASYNKFSHINTTIRNEVSDKIEKNWGGVGSFAYQTGMSMADFLLNTAITGGNSAFSLGIMGSSAAADTVISAKDRGLSDSQAYSLGIIAGAAEIITEKVSIDALLDKTTLGKNALEYVLKNVLSEGGEEVSSSVINLVADVLISKDKSEWQALVNKYVDQGMNEQKAFLHAVGEQAISLGLDFLGGAISGGVMGGGSVGINKAVNKFEQNRFTKSLGQDILDFGNKDALMELAKQMADNKAVTRAATKVEKNASAKNVGKLSQSLVKEITKNQADLESDLMKEGLTREEARLVAKYSMGEDLSEAEEKKVESNEKYIDAVNKVFAKKNKTLTTEAKSEIIESEATANESNAEAESIRVRDGGERLGSENTERPILQMERGSGPYSQWRKALGTKPRDSQAARIVNKGREVTVASLGIAKGSNIHKVRLVDVENETDSMKKARKQAESRGLTVKFFVGGNLVIEENIDDNIGKADEDKTYFEANGYINGKVMLVRADHYKFTADQIARHESGHDMIAKGEVDIKSVRKRLIEIAGGKENIDDISKLYAEAYKGTTLDGDEIFEELICDSLGDMNIFAYGEEAAELMALAIPDVQRAVNETKGEPNQTRGSPESEGKASKEFSSPEEAKESGKISDAKFSIEFAPKIADNQRAYLEKGGARISSVELEKAISDTARMVDKMIPYANILPQDKVGKTLVKNGSYDVSVENTTVCIRTLAYNSFVDMVSEKIGRPLTQMESFLVSQKLYEIAKEPQCLYCYVSLDRKAFNEMVIRYTEQRDAAVRAYEEAGRPKVPSSFNADWSLFKEFLDGRKPTKNMWDRYTSWIKAYNSGERMVSLADISTEAKRLELVENGGAMASQVKDILKYAQSASWAKKQTQYVAYYDEILKLKPNVIKNLNSHYGMRWYSFSDYSGAFIVENMQQITDAAIRGLKGLSYTKDTDFAEIFAPTGMNINISVYATKTANGYEIDAKQSANIEEAIKLRKKYPNVGIVVVATDKGGVEWALTQEWSDVVIPFHTVRTGADVAEFYNWEIFNAEQNDTVSDQNLWDEYVKSVGKKKVSKMVYPSEHQNDLDTYLEICKERGLTPRFKSFLDNPNYMKLVNETRQSESETAPLKAIFDVDAAERSFDKFVEKGGYYEGWYNDGIDVDGEAEIVAADVLAGKKANEVDYGRQDVDFDALKKSRKDNRTHGKTSRELDTKHLTAAENGDIETAHRMVGEAAKEAGYPTKVYHGTTGFGFTKIDITKGDDGISFFATDSLETASTYSGTEGTKKIVDASKQTEEERDKIIKEIYSEANDLAEYCNKTLGIRGWVDYNYFDKQLSESIDDLEYGVKLSDINSDFLSFCDDLFYTFIDNYYGENYDDPNKYGWEEWEDTEEYAELSDAFYDRVDRVMNRFALLDYDSSQGIYDLYANTDGMLEVDAQGKRWNAIPFEGTNVNTRRLASYAKGEGYTGVKITNVIDDGGKGQGVTKPATVYIFFKPQEQVKSADPITYDDKGEVIPLSKRFDKDNSDVRYSRNFEEDKYYQRQIDHFDELKEGSYITVGQIKKGSPLNQVGFPDSAIYFDVSKITQEMGTRLDPISVNVMKMIPKVLDNPIVITEFVDKYGAHSANVYGHLYIGRSPVVVGVMMRLNQKGAIINKIKTVHANRDVLKEMTDDKILYLSENKKETKMWFQSLGKTELPLGGNRFGFIRSISQLDALVNTSDKNSSGSTSRELDVITHMDAVAIAEGREMYEGKAPTDRERLANALESITENDIERKKLKEYKANIEKMNAETEKLAQLKAEIKELTFGKGKKDPQRLKELKAEATKTENRINTYDKMLLNLEASSVLKGVLMREKQKAYKRAAEKGREALHKNVVGRNKTVMRHKIQDVAHRLDKLLNNATKERNVKKGQSELVRRVLDLTDLLFASDDDLLMNGIETEVTDAELDAINKYTALYNEYHSYDDAVAENKERRKELRSEMNDVKKAFEGVLERERKRISKAKSTDVFNALISEYENIAKSKDEYIAHAFDKETREYLEGLRDAVGDTLVKDMTLDQLEMVYKAFRMIETMVSKSNKMFNESLKATAEELGTKTLNEVLAHKRKTEFTRLGKAYSELSWNNLKPIYLMERIGSKTLQMLFDNVLSAESDWAKYEAEARKYSDEMKEKYGFKDWDFKKKWKFTTKTGLEFELDLGQIFTIYAYAQRGEQALNHLRVDGFVFDKLKVIKKNKLGIPMEYELNDKTAYKLDDDNLMKIVGNPLTGEKGILTDDQINYVVAMQKYLSETLGKRGNEVSEQMYGIDLFNEENYLPIRSEGAYMERVREQAQGTPKIKNRAHTKPTVKGARNAIVLTNFNEIWAEHVTSMNEYVAFTLPLEDFYKVYNYTNKSSEDSDKRGVIPAIENAYGKAASKAVDQLLTDLNGGTRTDSREGVGKALMGAFKKAKVMLSLSVVVQQPSSIIRAQAVIDPKYFVGKPDGKKHKEAWAELKKYAPVAIIKEMGYFDVGMGQTSAKWLMNEPDFMDKVDEVTSWGAAKADEMTWIAIWNAVKRETLHTHKDLAPNSEAFLEAAGKRFEEIIRLTQVYDSTLSRSANMRSKSAFMQMATAFLAEPTTSLNMREMALRSGDKARIARTTAAVYASALLNAILVAFPYAMRDDDEDETFAEKYLSALTSSFVNNINPLTSIPFIKDIWSLAQGYSVGRSDMTLVDDFIGSVERLVKESVKEESDPMAIANAIVSLVGDFANFTGIPLKNLIREIKAMINFGKTISRDINGMDTTWNSIGDILEETFREETPIVGWLPKETKKEKIVEAIQKGDEAYVERFKSSYKDEDSFYSAIRSEVGELYRKGEITSREAKSLIVEYGGYEEDAENEAYWLIKEWDYKKKHGKDAEYSKYTEWYEAVKTGRNIKTVINDYTTHGVDKKTLASQITKYYKPIYIGMSNSERARLKGYLLNAYSLLGYNRSEKSRDIDAWLKG